MINRSIVSLMSSEYMMNSFGPVTEPCGTLQVSATGAELLLGVVKVRVRPV